jgi:hypothetical protein
MTNEYVTRTSSPITGKMQIKTKMRYPFTAIGMAETHTHTHTHTHVLVRIRRSWTPTMDLENSV